MDNPWFSREELLEIGVRTVGTEVRVDRSVRIFGAPYLELGNHVRIDCFCVLTAGPHGFRIGNYVHIGVGAVLLGGSDRIEIEDFAGLSVRACVFTSSDDFIEGYLTNPTIPEKYRKVKSGAVQLDQHVIIGAGAVILPGVKLGYGASVGALSLVSRSVGKCEIVSGCPAKPLKLLRNEQRIRQLEDAFLRESGPPHA